MQFKVVNAASPQPAPFDNPDKKGLLKIGPFGRKVCSIQTDLGAVDWGRIANSSDFVLAPQRVARRDSAARASSRRPFRCRAQASSPAHSVARGRAQLEVLINPLQSSVNGPANAAYGLAQAEVFLDAFANDLAAGETWMPALWRIDRAADNALVVARHIWRHVALSARIDEVSRVVNIIRGNERPRFSWKPVGGGYRLWAHRCSHEGISAATRTPLSPAAPDLLREANSSRQTHPCSARFECHRTDPRHD